MTRKITEGLIEKIRKIKGLACQSIEVLWGHSFPERAKLLFHYPTDSAEREIQMRVEIDPSRESPIIFHERMVLYGGYTPKELEHPSNDYYLLRESISRFNCDYRKERRSSL
jgi:hypothetical protein